MRWRLNGVIYDTLTRRLSGAASTAPLWEPDGKVLEFLIDKRFERQPHDNKAIIDHVWGKAGSKASLYQSIARLRSKLGGGLETFILTRPYRLHPTPQPIDPDEHTAKDTTSNDSNTPASSELMPLQETDEWSDFILDASCPDEEVLSFASRCDAADRRVIGSVVEVFGHPYLEGNQALKDTGWAANEVFLTNGGLLDVSEVSADKRIATAFAASELDRRQAGLGSVLEGDNNPKFTIVDVSTPFHDLTTLSVTLKQTDYFTIRHIRPAITRSPEIRHDFGHIIPRKNRLPQGAAIAFAAIFDGDDILAIHRDVNTFPFPETWSFSGEEQFDASDMQWPEPERMTMAMLRTAQEEIFPLARINGRKERLAVLGLFKPYIKSTRVWSVFLEDPTATYCLFCVYELNISVPEYSRVTKRMVQQGLGQPSREGHYYSVKLSDVPALLQNHTICAVPIFGNTPAEITCSDLHPTSRYRLIRIIDHLHRQNDLNVGRPRSAGSSLVDECTPGNDTQ